MNTIISGRVRKLVFCNLDTTLDIADYYRPKGPALHSTPLSLKKQPFCDGAHKTKAQGLMPLRFVPEKDSKAWLCGCKYTANPPYCDGTHKQEFIQSALLPVNTHS
ncbi:hypothetical protein J4Q44_G00285100 [Coregonus suidteri]|uniref:Iron-binding zinc finger CDGSH type domain-containing protein n=1 Tax=Coregonus suidteri TaxID=861788 RepID=A0AAN8QSX3_9TELE